MYRQTTAVTPQFGPANRVFLAIVQEPLACLRGKSRPIWRYAAAGEMSRPNGGHLSLPPVLPNTTNRSYAQQLPGVEQLYIPGLRAPYDATPAQVEEQRRIFAALKVNGARPLSHFLRSRLDALPPDSKLSRLERQRLNHGLKDSRHG